MAVTHTSSTRGTLAEAIRTLANANGTPELGIHQTSGDTLLCTIEIPDFGAQSSGTITSAANGNDGTAGASGTAGYCRVNDGAGTEIFRGSVTATGGGGDVEINSTTITSGDTIALTTDVTYSAPS
jgi:hypothetical protein